MYEKAFVALFFGVCFVILLAGILNSLDEQDGVKDGRFGEDDG